MNELMRWFGSGAMRKCSGFFYDRAEWSAAVDARNRRHGVVEWAEPQIAV